MRTLLCASLVALCTCVKNPATGERQLSLISQQEEIRLGEEAAQQVEQTIGLVDERDAQRYVQAIGGGLAARSEAPDLPWSFALIDDPTPNAFALPGGKIFVTRGLFVHLANEAQLASVLGHEIGHVTARHSAEQMSKAQLAQVGLGVGALLLGESSVVPLAAAGLEALFLKFSREDEYQADELGIRYAGRGGYDLGEMPGVFRMLDRVSSAEGGGRIPEWLSTHPSPENRIERIEDRIREQGIVTGRGKVGEQRHLRRTAGLIYGPDPRDGFFRGDRFYHPEFGFSVLMPEGWQRANFPEAVVAASPEEDAVVQLALSPTRDPEAALAGFARESGARVGERADLVDELPSASAGFVAETEQGLLRGIVTFVALGEHTFQILAITPVDRFDAHAGTFQRIHASFAELTDPRLRDVRPARIALIEVRQPTTLSALYARDAASVPLEEIALLNQMQPDDRLQAGQLVKWVRGGEGIEAQ